ncbi:hypothetical protein B0I32_10946 [Nonomuraea fuscirosea]|uniref:Uncharacterized protein n=1 Tax=Nonomuraea fuscirosea TaxID=1291556 RepID=A0A2T0MXZ8_9ACTN|nr:hypothetical protein B0I32_10946 [Nonomuraea fuscirosea]
MFERLLVSAAVMASVLAGSGLGVAHAARTTTTFAGDPIPVPPVPDAPDDPFPVPPEDRERGDGDRRDGDYRRR